VEVRVRVDIAETRANGVVHEEEIRELVPGTIVVDEVLSIDAVGADLHESAILRTAARAAVEPDDCPLAVGDVLVLKVPEEEISIVFCVDFDVSAHAA
jgi:hypothetical protein